MIRKQTWILLAVFILLLGGAFYLQKNPLPSGTKPTPSPTATMLLLPGWKDSDIVKVVLQDAPGSSTQVSQDDKGNWKLILNTGKETTVAAGMVEQLRSAITSMNVQATLPSGYALDALGLKSPAKTLTIQNKQGQQAVIHIGSATPTGNGYYLQVNNQAPVVVDKGAVDGALSQFDAMHPTPTPEPGTPSPTSSATETATP